jgi:hypothetical protein
MDSRNVTDERQLLTELARSGSGNRQEPAVLVSPGGGGAGWPIRVKSHVAYNRYKVVVIVLGEAGTTPDELGDEMDAVNLAEPFLSQGALAAGACAIMTRAGQVNAFYAAP